MKRDKTWMRQKNKCCESIVHIYINRKMRPVETVSEIGERG
jgi:hypothetical protein